MLRPPGQVLLVIVAALALGGCSDRVNARLGISDRVDPEVQVGSGVAASIPWVAWIYRDRDQLTCLVIRDAVGGENGGCGDGTGPNVSGGPPTTFVYGGTAAVNAAAARVTLADKSQSMYDLVLPAAGVTTGVRYYVATLPGAAVVTAVEILDGAGVVVESYPLGP